MKLGAVPRLLRVQFTPIMMAPVFLGAAIAWRFDGSFSPFLFALALVGSVCLHLAANGIDDVYDYLNGTDKISDALFPRDAPGWKPIPRGILSVGEASLVSYLLYATSLAIGVVLSLIVGWFALLISVPGVLLSYFYTAPPLRLDYRGMGLGEVSVFLSFGPIPVLGVYYVMSAHLSALPFVLGVPAGLLTTAILVSHDRIYFDSYKESGKRSITIVLGKARATRLATWLSFAAYAVLVVMVAFGAVPVASLLAFFAFPVLLKFADFRGRELSPPEYGAKTTLAFLDSTLFTFLLAVGILLG
jgi:1,4-dihydroxy-2-naphthoate octaprenyltransferase